MKTNHKINIFFAVLIGVVITSSCKHEYRKVISSFHDGKPEIVRLYPDEKDTSGYWYMHYYENGQLFVKGFVKNSKWEGHWQWWYEDGKNRDSAYLVANKYMDVRKHWYLNGKVKEIEYLTPGGNCVSGSGCCIGRIINYDTLGRITEDKNVKEGKFDGPQILYYYESGPYAKTKLYMEYKNDLRNGKRIEWYANGNRTEGQYLNGIEEGTWHYYRKNKEYSTNEFKNGKAISIKYLDTLKH